MEYDIRMQVKLCRKHKKFYNTEVKVKLAKGIGMRPDKLVKLWTNASVCHKCQWKTSFDHVLKKQRGWSTPSSRKFR